MLNLRDWARGIKRETLTLYYAVRDPRTPWLARLVAGLVVAYALSPIDLIPDFIPVLGYLDELVILPLGIWFALKLVPAAALEDARLRAAERLERPTNRTAALVIVAIWVGLASLAGWGLWRILA